MMKILVRPLTAWLVAGLFLTACGGGSTPPAPVAPPPPPLPPPPSSNATLADIGLSTGSLDQVFQSDIKGYTGTTSFLGTTTTLRATASDANASISINGAIPVIGSASESMALASGPNLATITVLAEDGVSGDSYTVDMSRADASGLAHVGYVKASNTDAGDRFGGALAVSGNTFAVAASTEDSAAAGINGDGADNSEADAGAVYVFHQDAAGTWSQEAYLKSSNASGGHAFGHAIALSGETV